MWGTGTGSEVMQRIAAPMVGGMVTAPLLSMFVIPAAYLLMRRPREHATSRWAFWRRRREAA
jgi:Cu(I)/Ag(I) efflux system membrane protein CusA/SilA